MASSASRSDTSPARSRPGLDRLIFVIALLGVLVTIHLRIQEGRGFDQGCWGFNPEDAAAAATFNCEAVTNSAVGRLFGLPNSVLGFLFYVTVAALSAAAAFAPGRAYRFVTGARAALVGFGFLFSLYLVYAQRFLIGELCALCLTSAGIATTLLVVTAAGWFGARLLPERRAPSRSAFRRAAFFGTLAFLVAGLGVADVVYFRGVPSANDPFALPARSASADASWAEAHFAGECRFDPQRSPARGWEGLVTFTDAVRGAPEAPVTVVEYFDPNCSHCRTTYPVMEELVDRYGDRVRFVFKPFVLRPNEEPWLRQVEALYAAGQEGRFFELTEAQFARQDRLTPSGLPEAELRAAIEEAGLDADALLQRLDSGLYRPHALQERERAIAVGLQGVPMILVDGMVVAPNAPRTPECLGRLVDAALARPTS